MPTIRIVVLLLALLGLATGTIAVAPPPNVVFIFADDLGYADLGCYGHPYARTPAIDRLASEGTRFTQAYVTGVTCCPSRTGFMTGLWPSRFAKYPAGHGFGDRPTITSLLKTRGYRTGHFGKWHIGPDDNPAAYGIDVYQGGGGGKDDPRGRDAHHFDDAIAFIKANAKGPFYVNLWGHATHYPVNTHPELVNEFRDVTVKPGDFSPTMQHKFAECRQIGGDINTAMRQYLGDVYSIDLGVARLLAALDELGLRDNTIVVFSSDHGPAPVLLGAKKEAKEYSANMLGYAGDFRGGKHEQTEGGVRVPFIVRWPDKVKANHVDATSVISGIDWLPTICRLAGVKKLPADLDGEDVSPAWRGQPWTRSKPLLWRVSNGNGSPAIRDGKWKFQLNPRRDQESTLYDLTSDPSESNNLAARHPEVVAALTRKLEAWVKELPTDYDKSDPRKKTKRKRPNRAN